MDKKVLIAIIAVVILAAGGGAWALASNNSKKSEDAAMMQKDDAMMEDDDSMMKDEDAMMEDDKMMAKQGSYVTLADYEKDKAKYEDTAKVYFFHASWCPVCQGINKAIEADPGQIPAGATIIKTDFDNETELRQKYGVTYQYTFVQVDNDGNLIKKWSASNLDDVVNGIQL